MKSIFLLISTLAVFTACSTPHIIHNEDTHSLELSLDNFNIADTAGAKLLYKSRVNLSNINIYQFVYQTQSGLVLTYEDIQVSSGYLFTKGMKVIVHNVFTDYSYDLVYTKGNTYFFKLISKKDQTLMYLLLEKKSNRSLQMIYGFTTEVFNELIQATKEKRVSDNTMHINKPIKLLQDKSAYIRSQWNYKNIILDNLISKAGSGRRVKR